MTIEGTDFMAGLGSKESWIPSFTSVKMEGAEFDLLVIFFFSFRLAKRFANEDLVLGAGKIKESVLTRWLLDCCDGGLMSA